MTSSVREHLDIQDLQRRVKALEREMKEMKELLRKAQEELRIYSLHHKITV